MAGGHNVFSSGILPGMSSHPPDRDGQDAAFGRLAPTPIQAFLIALGRANPLARGAVRKRLARLLLRLRPGAVDCHAFGRRFRVRLEGNATDIRILLDPRHDRRERAFLSDVLDEGGVFVDIGANVGLYALTLAPRVGASGRVLAVEPNPDLAARLAFNAAANRASAVSIVRAALGAAPGRAFLAVPSVNMGQARIDEADGLPVPMETLANLARAEGVTRIDALKIDVEGFEDRVLVPFLEEAPDALLPSRIVLEHTAQADWRLALWQALEERGYRVRSTAGGNSLLAREPAAPSRSPS